jgi:hypothetical protein
LGFGLLSFRLLGFGLSGSGALGLWGSEALGLLGSGALGLSGHSGSPGLMGS